MTLLNLAEPLSREDVSAISALSGRKARRVVDVVPKLDDALPLAPQVRALVDGVGLSAKEWETTSVVVCLPNDPVAATLVVAEIAGRRGRAPTVVRYGAVTPRGKREPAELISLHEVRKEARHVRKGWGQRSEA